MPTNDPNDYIEMKIPAKAEYVGVVRLLVSGIANRVGFSTEDTEDITLAVAEAVTNAIVHAYKEKEGTIIVGCTSYQDRFEVSVNDHGESSDLDRIHSRIQPIQADAALDTLDKGGLGLYLINTMMDKVEIIRDAGILMMMTKYKK